MRTTLFPYNDWYVLGTVKHRAVKGGYKGSDQEC